MTRPRVLAAVALGAATLAFALPVQDVGCGQNAQYVATKAVAAGQTDVDRYAGETCDLVRDGGHYYAAKALALAFWSAPWYLLLDAAGAVPANPNAGQGYPAAMLGTPPRALWQIGLWAIVLPALGLLVLVRRTVERLEPGLGTAAAVVLGLGTLVLPFSTMLFAHVPAALLGFLAFALLFERDAGLQRVALAGAAAGLAVSTDLPLAVPALCVGLYACSRAPHLRRLVAYVAGVVAGLVPLLAFDWWAFGSPFHLAYSHAAINPGPYGVEQTPTHTFFTLGVPDFRLAVQLLLGGRGLLVLTPVLGAGAAGVVLLWRRGLRREALLIAALCVVEITWNSGRPDYPLALGGWVPGPRLLIPLLPFLCFALASALRRAPLTVGALAVVSVGAMTAATSAGPLLSNDDTRHWLSRIVHGSPVETALAFAGADGGIGPMLLFYALVAVAAAAAAACVRVPLTRRDARAAVAALVAWGLVEHGAPELFRIDAATHKHWGLLAAILLVAAAVAGVVRVHVGDLRGAALALPLLAFATVRFSDHTKWALVLCVSVLAALAAFAAGRARRVAGTISIPATRNGE
jgi:hypothetical protein